jgi:hypothetical protein
MSVVPRATPLPEPPISRPDPGSQHAAVEVAAFTPDCRLSGRVVLTASRLTDLLNADDAVRLSDAHVVFPGGGKGADVGEIVIPRDELVAVSAAGPRGDPAMRTETHRYRMMVRAGPYLIHGYLHASPGMDPLTVMDGRGPMLPLTEVRIEREWGGERWVEWMAAVIVNRESIDLIWPLPEEDFIPPSATPAAGSGPRGRT